MQNPQQADAGPPAHDPDAPEPPPPIPPAPVGYIPGTYAPAASAWRIAPAQTSGQASGALAFAVVGLVSGWLVFPLVASLVGIVFGHLALGAIGRAGGYLRGRGLAIAALICGYGAIIFWIALLVV